MLRWFDELAGQGVFTTDTELVVRSWNRWLERHTGLRGRRRRRPAAARALSRAGRSAGSIVTTAPRSHGEVTRPRASVSQHLLRHPAAARRRRRVDAAERAHRAAARRSAAVVGTITVIDDVTRARDQRARAAQADRRRGSGARGGGGGVARQGRVPGDAVARDPHAAQRRARLDQDPARPSRSIPRRCSARSRSSTATPRRRRC